MNRNTFLIMTVIMVTIVLLGAVVSAQDDTAVAGATALLLQYQGRLSDPSSGEPVADGSYTMVFRLYTAPSGGSALWTETKDVPVQGGLFSTVLGDATPLSQGLFNGQALWLGIKVGTDEEAAPRQQVLPVAYALSLAPGATIQTNSSGAALSVSNSGSGQALRAGGSVVVDGNLSVEGSLSGGDHNHSGGDITSGQVAEPRIAAAIARDGEVTGAISSHTANGGAHHTRYTDEEAISAMLAHPEFVTQYEFQDHIYGGFHPIAAGVINGDGSISAATGNVTSSWNSAWQCFEISIAGHYYEWPSYVTAVTPISGGIANAWSNSGKLRVGIYDLNGSSIKLPFQFVIFKP